MSVPQSLSLARKRSPPDVSLEASAKVSGTSVPSRQHLDLEPPARLVKVHAFRPQLRLSFAKPDSTARDEDTVHWHVLFPKPPGT